MSRDRLITNKSKRSWHQNALIPYASRAGHVRYVNYVGYVMYSGHEDFPLPESFR